MFVEIEFLKHNIKRTTYDFYIPYSLSNREKKGETLNTEKQEPASTDLRNRKSKSIKFKSGKDYIPSREGSIKSHHTPKSYKVKFCTIRAMFLIPLV